MKKNFFFNVLVFRFQIFVKFPDYRYMACANRQDRYDNKQQ